MVANEEVEFWGFSCNCLFFYYVYKIQNIKKLQNCKKSQEIIINCDGVDIKAGRSSKFLII